MNELNEMNKLREATSKALNLRETTNCPCYRLASPLDENTRIIAAPDPEQPNAIVIDHICRLTTRASCSNYFHKGLGFTDEVTRLPLALGMTPAIYDETDENNDWPLRLSSSPVVVG